MTTVYVEVPISSARIKGMDCYCCNCASDHVCDHAGDPCNSGGYCTSCGSQSGFDKPCKHHAARLASPVDVGCGEGLAVYCHVSTSIQSIYAELVPKFCGTTVPSGWEWVNEGVEVTLYTSPYCQGTMVGKVFYGHLKNRISSGVHNRNESWILGLSGSGDCCECYGGGHIHMERSTDHSASTYYRSCDTPVTSSYHVYSFTY